MKILIATPYFHPRTGGLENYARQLGLGLVSNNWEVVVVCGDFVKTVTREEQDGLIIYRLPIWKIAFNTPINPAWPFMIRRIIRAEKPDVINAHAPVVFMADVAAMAVGRLPFVLTYHAATLFKPGSRLMSLTIHAYQLLQRLTFWRANAIITVSPYVKNALGQSWAHKTHVVYNAVPGVSAPRQSAGRGLVFVANLEPTHAWKGLDLILEALGHYKKLYGSAPTLTVIGDGSDRPRYEQKTADLGISSSVNFAGRRVGKDRDNLMRKATALVAYPTTANDAFPTVFLEAWALGLPVLAAAIGPIPSLVKDSQTGLLVPPHNSRALAGAIHALLESGDLAQQMGEAGRQQVESTYTWKHSVDRTISLLRGLS